MSSATSPVISDALYSAANEWIPGSISPVTNGRRTISGQLLSPDSAYGSASSSSSSSSENPTGPLSSLQVPAKLESPETMAWIGFDDATSDRILNDYLTDFEEMPLQRHIENHIRYYEISEVCNNTKTGNCYLAMTQLGISVRLQQSVMDPEFEFVRSWHPLRYWLELFVVSNYLSLVSMDKRALAVVQQSQGDILQLHGGADSDFRADYYSKKAGYTTLYRTTTAGRLKNAYGDSDRIRLQKTISRPDVASDFGYEAYGSFSYWTPNAWVAELYGRFCERNVQNVHDVCVLKLVARDHDIEVPGKTWRLNYGYEWRKLVWYSRTQNDYPKDILDKHMATEVFIGPLSVDATPKFEAMSSWTDVTAANVCRQNDVGEEAVQYAFHMPKVLIELSDKSEVDLFRFQSKKLLADPKTWVAGR
ncbi:hypothetical protein SVAN01_08974 [Stagonosporopsis vannaccii]|nr:hypothetical protein SVAN01_08974 [Stagonosporopsis vannaccii]